MTEKVRFLYHHDRIVSRWANEPGSPEEVAEKYVSQKLDCRPCYQTFKSEIRAKIVRGFAVAVEAKRAGNVGEPIVDNDFYGQLVGDVICEHCVQFDRDPHAGDFNRGSTGFGLRDCRRYLHLSETPLR